MKHIKRIREAAKMGRLLQDIGFQGGVFASRMVEPPQQHRVVRPYKAGDTIVCPNCGMDMKATPKVIGGTEVLYWTCDPETQCGYSFAAE